MTFQHLPIYHVGALKGSWLVIYVRRYTSQVNTKQNLLYWQCSFLEMSHSWRNCKEYDGRTKRKVPPRNFSIEDILSQLEAISQSIPWKAITTLK